jgi:hypothetical protein
MLSRSRVTNAAQEGTMRRRELLVTKAQRISANKIEAAIAAPVI